MPEYLNFHFKKHEGIKFRKVENFIKILDKLLRVVLQVC